MSAQPAQADEHALGAVDATFRAAFEHASVGMALATLDEGRWTEVNPALCALLGRTRAELLGMGLDHITHPDDIEQNVTGARMVRAGTIPVYETQKRYLHVDGHVIWVALSVSLLRDSRLAPRCYIVHVLDITDRKRAEDALAGSERHLADAQALGGVGSWAWDRDGGGVTWSDELCRIAGFTSDQAPTTFDGFMALVHDDDREALARTLEQDPDPGGVSEREYRLVRPEGDVRWVRACRHTVYDAAGEAIRLAGTVQDITERVASQLALRDAEERFRKSFDDAPIGMALVSLQGHWMNCA